jgi:hypothetical protein
VSRTIPSAIAIAATCLLAGCDEKLSDVTGPTSQLTVSFASIQAEIFESSDSAGRVACINCHAPGRPAAFIMDLSTPAAYASLVNRAAVTKPGAIRVIPGDPDNSYLVQKLEGRLGIVGERMPRTFGPFLTDGQMAVIRRWIEIGAPNN